MGEGGLKEEEKENMRKGKSNNSWIDEMKENGEIEDEEEKGGWGKNKEKEEKLRWEEKLIERMGCKVGRKKEERRMEEGENEGIEKKKIEWGGKKRKEKNINEEDRIENEGGGNKKEKGNEEKDGREDVEGRRIDVRRIWIESGIENIRNN